MNKNTSLVFFGSGSVAAKSLQLLAKKFAVEAIITKPSTVDIMKASVSAPIFTVNSDAELDDLITSRQFKSRLGVLVDFGIIISQAAIDSFSLGIINSHFSLLPEWRGADPITFAILSEQEETGVSLMLLVQPMDEGPLLAQKSLAIEADDTSITLTEKLIRLSNKMLTRNLPEYLSGSLVPTPQRNIGVSYSRKLTKADGLLDWTKSAEQLEREIRAFIEWPKSRAWLGETEIIITEAHAVPSDFSEIGAINTQTTDNGEALLEIQCGHGHLYVERLKPAGGREMSAAEFLRGHKAKIGSKARLNVT